MVDHTERLRLQRYCGGLASCTDTGRPAGMIPSGTRNLDLVGERVQRWEERLCRDSLVRCDLSQICVVREILDVVLFVICGIIWLKRHAVVAHAFGPVLAELSVFAPWNFCISCAPVLVYRIFLESI